MKAVLCNFCLKSGILCSKCQGKLKSGQVSEIDLEIARLLLSLEKEYPPLQDLFFYKAIEADRVLAILVGKGDLSRILGYGGKILKILGTKTGKQIRILEKGGNYRKFLEQLFIPFPILTINTIWLPDGTTETRVIVKQRGRKRLPIGIDALKEIAQKARGITLRVEFSR